MGALKPAGADGGARRAGQQPAMSHINGQPAGQAASAMVPLVYMDGRMIDALPCASKTSMACFNAAGMPLPPPPSHFISCNPQRPLSHAPGWRDNNDLLKSACWPWLAARPKPQIVFPRSILYTSRLNGLKIMCTISLYLVIFSI